MVEMELARILISETRDAQIIVLREKDGERAFPIVIGYFEAAAIDRHVKEIPMPRPLTHDLINNIIAWFDAKLARIVVNDLRDNTFYGRLHIQWGDRLVDVDTRPSDAIALAVLNGCPIFVEEHVLDEVCASFDIEKMSFNPDADEDADEEDDEDDEDFDEDDEEEQ